MTRETAAYREIARRALDQNRLGRERNHGMNDARLEKRRFNTRFVTRTIFMVLALSILVLGSPARADGLFTKTTLTCHFDHGGKWNYDLSPPRQNPVEPWRIKVTNIDLKRGHAVMRGEKLSVRRHTKSLYFFNFWKLGAPGDISVYSFSVLGGFPAVAQAGFLQVAGHCN
jgi:hypothetical protein